MESAHSQDFSVNDCFKPVSKYWDRINRPDQLLTALPEAMRILTSPSETGAVTVCLPQDVQTEAYDYPVAFFRRRVWHIMRNRADRATLAKAAEMIRAAKQPMIVAGGGVIYAEATDALRAFVDATGIPVGETMAGKGSLTMGSPAQFGRNRGDGHLCRQPHGQGRGSGHRHRHPLQRLHHGVQDGVAAPGCALHQHQRGRV